MTFPRTTLGKLLSTCSGTTLPTHDQSGKARATRSQLSTSCSKTTSGLYVATNCRRAAVMYVWWGPPSDFKFSTFHVITFKLDFPLESAGSCLAGSLTLMGGPFAHDPPVRAGSVMLFGGPLPHAPPTLSGSLVLLAGPLPHAASASGGPLDHAPPGGPWSSQEKKRPASAPPPPRPGSELSAATAKMERRGDIARRGLEPGLSRKILPPTRE
mmetsp:Transcript_15544/g.41538  ORF Transcript_15544/g.41538 Transcript_15544/m.41538 type:complete len:213 (+) Transcript_15544:991-1629(+)